MRTVLAGSEPMVRNALRALMTQGLAMRVVSEADSLLALQGQVELHKPDIVIVSWKLIVAQAESLLTGLRDSSEGSRIIVLGIRPETRQAALTAGADDYISMVDAPEVVVRALQPREMIESGGPS